MVAFADVVDQVFARDISTNFAVIPPALLFPKVTLNGGSAALSQILDAVNRPYFVLVLGVRCEEYWI